MNLVPQELPGDLYRYVADYVWERLQSTVSEYSKKEIEECNELIDKLSDLKKQIQQAEPKSDRRKELVDEIRAFKDKNSVMLTKAGPVYWCRIVDAKHKRKIVKR